ncbi:hypothetical protein SAZ11_53985 [Streptomyces sp. FXJ1.4098]|nr:hypothetical protein [Streptomyces sp. FXJ1.4098]
MSDDGFGFEWIQEDLTSWGFHLEMVKGVSVEELAAMLGADPDLGIMSPDMFNTAVRLSTNIPDWARLGEHAGWAFALCGAAMASICATPTMCGICGRAAHG